MLRRHILLNRHPIAGSTTRIPDTAYHRSRRQLSSYLSYPQQLLLAVNGKRSEILKDGTTSSHRSYQKDPSEDIIPKYNYAKAEWTKFQNIPRVRCRKHVDRLNSQISFMLLIILFQSSFRIVKIFWLHEAEQILRGRDAD